MRELAQNLESICRYRSMALDFGNIADLTYLGVGWLAFSRQFALGGQQLEKPYMSVWCGLAWLRITYSLRGEAWMGPRLLPILAALKDTAAFFLVTGMCVAGASHGYYNLELRNEPSPAYAAVMQVLRLGIFGDFDMFEFEGMSPALHCNSGTQHCQPVDPEPGPAYVSAHVLFYMTGFGVTILLMNLLVGVLGQNFELYQDRSEILFHRARAKFLLELRKRPWRPGGSKEENPGYPRSRYLLILGNEVGVDPPVSGCATCILLPIIFVCFMPLYPILGKERFRPFTEEVLSYRGGCTLLVLCAPIFVALSTCFLLIYALLGFVFRFQGLRFAVSTTLGLFGYQGTKAGECRIWLLCRKEAPVDEVRSVRTALKTDMQEQMKKQEARIVERLEKKHEEKCEELKQAQQEIDHKIGALTDLVQKLVDRTGP
ncbi:HMA5, partial [Symbiodinium necroappetens]